MAPGHSCTGNRYGARTRCWNMDLTSSARSKDSPTASRSVLASLATLASARGTQLAVWSRAG